MQPIVGHSPQPPGEPPGTPRTTPPAGEAPLSTIQRTVLERLITRIIALTQQQPAEVWAAMKHDLGLKNNTPMQSRHFPAAEQNLNQRLAGAQQTHETRQVLQQLNNLLSQGNNRQAVSNYIRQEFGHTALSQLSPDQLKTVLTVLQKGEIVVPQPTTRPATERPLLPAEHSTLNQLVSKLAASSGESVKTIWQNLVELSGAKSSEQIPARHFPQMVTWLQARETLAHNPAPTLQVIQTVLKQPLEHHELQRITDTLQQQWQATPQTVLTTAQVQEVLSQIFFMRAERGAVQLDVRSIQPVYNPFIAFISEPLKVMSARPGLTLFALVLVFCLVLLVL